MSLDCEEIHTYTGRTCKLNADTVLAKIQTKDPSATSQEATVLPILLDMKKWRC